MHFSFGRGRLIALFLLLGFADWGSIQVLDLQKGAPAYRFNYTYDVRTDNINERTIEKFSTNAFDEMWNCTNCPYQDYAKFVNYYKAYDYGDQWIQAALEGQETTFDNGNADFSKEGRFSRVGKSRERKNRMKKLRSLSHPSICDRIRQDYLQIHEHLDVCHSYDGTCFGSVRRALRNNRWI